MKLRNFIIGFTAFAFIMGCQQTITYESGSDGSVYTNDLLHGNISGKIVQSESQAKIFVSQEVPIDSTIIQPGTGIFRFDNLLAGNYDLFIRAENYRYYQFRNIFLQGGTTHYLGEIDLSTVPNLVASHYPNDQDEIVYDNRYSRLTVSITFTQPMDRESVEAAFSTDPPSEGRFYWGYYSREPSDNYFFGSGYSENGDQSGTITTFSKVSSFSYRMAQKDCFTDTTYTVHLSTAAMDTAGNHLRFPLEFEFGTVQSATTSNTIETSPVHGDINVSPVNNSGIRLTFPRRMDQESTEAALTISPDQTHIIIWPSATELMIYTGGPLMAQSHYEITVDSTALDRDGIALGTPFSFSFDTAPVQLTSSDPNNGEVYVNPDTRITMRFNTYMTKSSVESAFSIDPPVNGQIRWGTTYSEDVKTALTFFPSEVLQPNTLYTVTLSTAAADMFGTSISEPISFAFITRPE